MLSSSSRATTSIARDTKDNERHGLAAKLAQDSDSASSTEIEEEPESPVLRSTSASKRRPVQLASPAFGPRDSTDSQHLLKQQVDLLKQALALCEAMDRRTRALEVQNTLL